MRARTRSSVLACGFPGGAMDLLKREFRGRSKARQSAHPVLERDERMLESTLPILVFSKSTESLTQELRTELEDFFDTPTVFASVQRAPRLLLEHAPELVLVELAAEQSLRPLARMRQANPELTIVAIITAGGSDLALRAMREGANDFLIAERGESPLEQLLEIQARQQRKQKRRTRHDSNTNDLLLGTSHDLKGPLGVILTSAELLVSLPSDPERQRQLTNCIAASARGALGLIDSIVSVHRVQDGELQLHKQELNLSQLIETLAQDYAVVAEAHHVNLLLDPIDKNLMALADRTCLSRVLANLVHNAIKYTSENGSVRIQARKLRGGIEISVSDNGRGIAPDRLRHLFKRFSRLPEHAGIEGSGIGLYVSQAMVKAHGGRIRVRSTLGLGSVFSVRLPFSG